MNTIDFIILFLVIVLFLFGVRRFIKTKNNGCCGECETIKKIKLNDTNPSHYSYDCCFKVEDMVCENCATKLTNAFNSQENKYAIADLSKKTLHIFTNEPPNPQKYMELVRQLGYTCTEL